MTLTTELDKIDAATLAIRGLPTQPPLPASLPAIFVDPKPNEVFQKTHGPSGVGNFRATWRGTANLVRLKKDGALVEENAIGIFSSVAHGWYDLILVTDGVEGDTIKVGVGDVYVVAGQSNAVSPLQPAGFVLPVPAPGRVILSDYYKFGFYNFRDVGVNPLTEIPVGGCCWLYMAIARNHPWPMMFVNIAQGSSSTTKWTTHYGGRLMDAIARHPCRAILWDQGVSDAGENISQATSFGNMDALILGLRHQTNTPWIMAVGSWNGGYAPIRAAQQAIIDKWEHVHQGPDLDLIRQPSGRDDEYLAVSPVGNQLQAAGSAWAANISWHGW